VGVFYPPPSDSVWQSRPLLSSKERSGDGHLAEGVAQDVLLPQWMQSARASRSARHLHTHGVLVAAEPNA
jgi:hypothetical protein